MCLWRLSDSSATTWRSLYDIDIGVQAIARSRGVNVKRIASMNSDPAFIEAVADAVEEKLN